MNDGARVSVGDGEDPNVHYDSATMGTSQRIFTVVGGGGRQARTVFESAFRKPSAGQRALAVALLVFLGIPILIIAVILAVALMIVLAILGVGALAMRWVRGLFPKKDGRENVRVVRRE